jgi:aryl-alcohol dehydrogenase-like predicted oxidoreductase
MSKTVTDEEIVEAYNELVKEGKINKVELGLADDFEKKFDATVDKDSKIANSLIDDLRKAEVAYNKIQNDYKESLKIGEKLLKQAKELGIKLPATISNKVESSKVGIKEMQKNISLIKKTYNLIN